MTLSLQKEELRRQMRAAARQIPPDQRARASAQLVGRVQELELWKKARAVLLYVPFPSEPDIRPLVPAGAAEGKLTALLRFDPAGDTFEPCRVTDLKADLAPGVFGVEEPRAGCPGLPVNQLDLLLVPGVAFCMSGCRLGRGRGYYDRFLARADGIALGLAFDWQIIADIPAEPHDMGVHCILTPTRWQEVTQRRRL